ncbi:MAG: TonB-dependent receptor [Bacteroidales bacterium]|nr:TonB-dependent receptor [Bacteroidales bacterium]
MNFKFLISLAVTLCIGSQILQAEINDTGKLSGKLLDKETKNAIDFVNITLYDQASATPYKAKISDTNGSFTFTDVKPGSYRLETKLLGYLSYNETIDIAAGNEKNLGEILLKPDSKLLKAVEVTGIRSNMKLEIDKKVFSVNQTIAAAGASASDILKDIPSVEIDAEGTVSLRNSESVTVWINGKPSGLTADNRGQVLEQMPAESIDRIEVITNPSAKFSPEGSAGIINIILKKDRKSGYYGSISAGASYPWGKNGGANINYSSSKIDAYANIGLRNEVHDGNGSIKRQTYKTDALTELIDTSSLNSESSRTFGGSGLFMRAGIDYHLNNKHTISLSAFAMDGRRNTQSEVTNNFLDNHLLMTRQSLRNSTGESKHNNYDMTMDYQWEIAAGHSLQANLSHGKRSDSDHTTYTQTDYNSAFQVTNNSLQKQTGASNTEDWEFKVDYSKKFSERWKLEAGMKSEWTQRYSDINIFNGISSGNNWIIPSMPNSSNGFDYDEQIHAVYGTLTGKMTSKFGYQLGLRGEKTIVSFISTDRDGASAPINKDYLELFPTIFLNYNFSEGSDIQLNYSKRINRPRGRALNPYVDISDSTNIRTGNPDLNPEFAHAFEMNFIKTWKSHTLSSSIYHRITNDVIQDIRYIETTGIMYQKPSNVTNSTSSGLELVSKDRMSKILETTATLNVYHNTMDAFTYRNTLYPGTSGFSWNARLNGTLIFGKGFSGQVSGFYAAPKIVAQGESKGNYSLDLGLRKNFLNNKLQLSVNARNILNSWNFSTTTRGPGFYQESFNQFFRQNVRVNLTWNFGNLKPKKKPGKDSNNDTPIDMGGFD